MKEMKSDRLHIVVTPSEKMAMTSAATSVGLTLSAWVRMVLLAASKKEKK